MLLSTRHTSDRPQMPYCAGVTAKETHEPDFPVDWPWGHVGVASESIGTDPAMRLRLGDVSVKITDLDDDECIVVVLGEDAHYLHSSTTRELSKMVIAHGDRAASVTIHGVTHTLNQKAVRALSQQLQARLTEWNRQALQHGFPGV